MTIVSMYHSGYLFDCSCNHCPIRPEKCIPIIVANGSRPETTTHSLQKHAQGWTRWNQETPILLACQLPTVPIHQHLPWYHICSSTIISISRLLLVCPLECSNPCGALLIWYSEPQTPSWCLKSHIPSRFYRLGLGNCLNTRWSIGGHTYSLGSGVISWQARKQKTVAASSCEVEYTATFKACKEGIWLQHSYTALNAHPLPLKQSAATKMLPLIFPRTLPYMTA